VFGLRVAHPSRLDRTGSCGDGHGNNPSKASARRSGDLGVAAAWKAWLNRHRRLLCPQSKLSRRRTRIGHIFLGNFDRFRPNRSALGLSAREWLSQSPSRPMHPGSQDSTHRRGAAKLQLESQKLPCRFQVTLFAHHREGTFSGHALPGPTCRVPEISQGGWEDGRYARPEFLGFRSERRRFAPAQFSYGARRLEQQKNSRTSRTPVLPVKKSRAARERTAR